jgi:hypothetical protein
MIFFSLSCNPDSGYRIYPKQRPTLGKMGRFSDNNPAGFFVKRDKLLSSVSDPHRFYADPDPAFLLNADPDPDPTCRI